jgi:hypothetical protein
MDRITAAMEWSTGNVFLFGDDDYVLVDSGKEQAQPGYPRPIAADWPGVFETGIDTAVLWNNGKAYFFKGADYVRYDVAMDCVDPGYPKPIAGNWPGVFEQDLDACVNWLPGKVLFFRGGQYLGYDVAADTADGSSPKPVPEDWLRPSGEIPRPADPILPEPAWATVPPRERVVRCCRDVLALGPMGHGLRGEFYRAFINCGMQPAGKLGAAFVGDISPWRTSCALFVRAVHHWCGRGAALAVNGSGIFPYLQASYQHPAWVPFRSGARPGPGDVFYVASSSTANDGHVGIFLAERDTDVWQTAEGGGSDGPGGAADGTLCRLSSRSFRSGERFDAGRTLLGWFDCDRLGFPSASSI